MSHRFDSSSIDSDDPLARHRKSLLERLAKQENNPDIAELAKEILSGRMTPFQAITSDIYSEAFAGHLERFTSWYNSLNESERDAIESQGQAHLDELVRGTSGEARSTREPGSEDQATEEDYFNRSWLE